MTTPLARLTPMQLRVLNCALKGMGDKQIAGTLGIQPNTVKQHMRAIRDRIDPNSRNPSYRWLLPIARQIGRCERT